MQNQAINDSFHESCDESCSSDADRKDRNYISDSDEDYPVKSPDAPITNFKGVTGLMKGNTMRAKRVMEKLNNTQEDNKDEKRIKEQTEEKRKSNIDKCMGGKDHAHGDHDDDYHGDRKSGCQTCKELVIMCLMDILLFLFLCS